MESVFHEKQEGSLCAQHCLNTLLQGPYYSAVDLGALAQQLDEEERQQMAEAGVESIEYLRFIQSGSSNMDDSGFFSVQVLSRALEVWTLELVPFRSRSHPVAERARADPCSQKAFICNFREHWFAVRKLGFQWFNLNSLLSEPELISDTYLSLFLAQLEQEGYSIFVVNGLLPDCDADDLLKVTPAVQSRPPRLLRMGSDRNTERTETETVQEDRQNDDEMELALAQSRAEFEGADPTLQRVMRETAELQEESDMELAIALSRFHGTPPASERIDEGQENKNEQVSSENPDNEDKEKLEKAVALSLESGETSDAEAESRQEETLESKEDQPSAEEIRQKRQKFLNRFN